MVVHAPAFDKGCWYEESTGTVKRLNCLRHVETSALGRPCDTGFAECDFSDFIRKSDVPNLDLPTLVAKPVTKLGVVKKPSAENTALDHAESKRIHSRGYHSVAMKYKSHPDCNGECSRSWATCSA